MRAVLLAAALAVGIAGCTAGAEAAPEVVVLDAYTIPGEGSLAIYLTLANEGGGDHIVAATMSGADRGRADRISLHRTVERDGLSIMEPAERLPVPGDSRTALEPGGGHLMVEGLSGAVELGDRLEITIEMDRSEPLSATVRAVTVDEALDRLLGEEGAR